MKALPILIVNTDHHKADLLAKDLKQSGFTATISGTLAELDNVIGTGSGFSLCVIDLSGFDDSIWERCERIRNMKIPCIIITPHHSPSVRRASIIYGADALLVHPISTREIIEYINTTIGK